MKLLPLFSAFILGLTGCSSGNSLSPGDNIQDANQIVEGGLYYSPTDDGRYSVSKVLVIDEFSFHVRLYANKFDAPPLDVKQEELSLGGFGSKEGFGIGHAPMAKEGFLSSNLYFIRQEKVLESELEGYKYYLEAMQQK